MSGGCSCGTQCAVTPLCWGQEKFGNCNMEGGGSEACKFPGGLRSWGQVNFDGGGSDISPQLSLYCSTLFALKYYFNELFH